MTTKRSAKTPVKKVAVKKKENRVVPYCIFVSTLANEDINVIKPIPVTIERESEDSFIASFVDAGVSSGGNSMQDAVWSLQEMIASSFRTLENLSNTQLGPKMRREKVVLLEFLCRRSQNPMQKIPLKN